MLNASIEGHFKSGLPFIVNLSKKSAMFVTNYQSNKSHVFKFRIDPILVLNMFCMIVS